MQGNTPSSQVLMHEVKISVRPLPECSGRSMTVTMWDNPLWSVHLLKNNTLCTVLPQWFTSSINKVSSETVRTCYICTHVSSYQGQTYAWHIKHTQSCHVSYTIMSYNFYVSGFSQQRFTFCSTGPTPSGQRWHCCLIFYSFKNPS